jgi:hypothetical protein
MIVVTAEKIRLWPFANTPSSHMKIADDHAVSISNAHSAKRGPAIDLTGSSR